MGKLFIKISYLFFLIVGSIGLTLVLNPYKTEDTETAYSAAMIDKQHRLDSLKSPKIVLVGGSNMAYGINSTMLEQAMKMPVVNMAIYYNLGTDFMLRSVKDKLHQGDILITGFEYIVSSEGDIQQKLLIQYFYPLAAQWIDYPNLKSELGNKALFYLSQYRGIIRRVLSQEHFRPTVSGDYDIFFRKGFNKYGDLISHLNNKRPQYLTQSNIDINNVNFEKPITDINTINNKLSKKGVKIYFSYVPFEANAYKNNKQAIKKVAQKLHQLGNFRILGTPESMVFPDSLCQDMVYHLNAQGRDIRTQRLIELLNKSKD